MSHPSEEKLTTCTLPDPADEPQTDVPPSAEVQAEGRRRAFRFHDWASAVRRLTTIGQTAKLVAAALADHANTKTGQCNPSHKTVAAEIGVTRIATISDAITALEAAKALTVSHGYGNRVSYTLLPFDTLSVNPDLRPGVNPKENYEEELRSRSSRSGEDVERAHEPQPEPTTATTTTDDPQDVDDPYLAHELTTEPWNDQAPQNAQFLLNEDTIDLLHSHDEIAEQATGHPPTRRPRDTERAQALLRHHYGRDEFIDEFIVRLRWAWTDPFSKRVVVHGMPTIEQYDGIGRGYDAVPKATCEMGGCCEQVVVTDQNKDWPLCPDCRDQVAA